MSNKIALEALQLAYIAMQHMGNVLNKMDAVDEEEDAQHDAAFEAVSAAIAALEAMEAGGWLPLDSAPKDGTYIHVQQQATYRWLPYKQASQEFKRGKKGRWQRYTGYGFDNADLVGSGWMNAELPTPPKD